MRFAPDWRSGHDPLLLEIIRKRCPARRASPRVQRHTYSASNHGSHRMDVADATGAMRRGSHGKYGARGNRIPVCSESKGACWVRIPPSPPISRYLSDICIDESGRRPRGWSGHPLIDPAVLCFQRLRWATRVLRCNASMLLCENAPTIASHVGYENAPSHGRSHASRDPRPMRRLQ